MTRSSMLRLPPSVSRPRHALRPRLDPLEGRLLLAAGDLDPTFVAGGLATTAFYTTGKKPTQVDAPWARSRVNCKRRRPGEDRRGGCFESSRLVVRLVPRPWFATNLMGASTPASGAGGRWRRTSAEGE